MIETPAPPSTPQEHIAEQTHLLKDIRALEAKQIQLLERIARVVSMFGWVLIIGTVLAICLWLYAALIP